MPPLPSEGLPLAPPQQGEAVRDLQRRLAALGYRVIASESGHFGPETESAVRRFQDDHGLDADGSCGRSTWSALVEAGYHLGDRLLYQRAPMLRGDDVSDLQRQLCAIGFDAGRVDGIFGPDTERALTEFQRNAGLLTDGVCGRDTLAVLRRLGDRTAGEASMARLREIEALRGAPRSLVDRRIAVGERGGLDGLSHAVHRALSDAGAVVAVLHHPDESEQATVANRFEADVYLCLDLDPGPHCTAAFFQVPGFESVGGRRLAELLADTLPAALDQTEGTAHGMRRPVLRETRMPAVACRLGPPAQVVERTAAIATAVRDALARWAAQPLPG